MTSPANDPSLHSRPPAPIAALTAEQVAREEQARIFGHVAGGRVLGIPIFVGALLALAWFEPLTWRRVVLLVMATALPAFFLIELRRYRKLGFERRAIPRNLSLTALGQLTLTAATGGILSPFIYGVLPIAAMMGSFMERRHRLPLTTIQVVAVVSFAVLGAGQLLPGFAFPLLSHTEPQLAAGYYYAHATLLSIATVTLGQVSDVLSRVVGSAYARASDAQQELLVGHVERVHELTTLSAEIAHELKNPLASIKGLAGLLTQNVNDERGAERLKVLRREIDRMQGALEEFLNFSRPLVPLSLQRCDVQELASEVVALHEGLARQRGVRVSCGGSPVEASCDPRKVKQILINLVQNALDASPNGSALRVTTEVDDDSALVSVTDEGSGIDPDLGDVFEPGTTSKSGGAGIGLTIARALARQHGGELTLQPRATRGTRADLRLPIEPLSVAEDAA